MKTLLLISALALALSACGKKEDPSFNASVSNNHSRPVTQPVTKCIQGIEYFVLSQNHLQPITPVIDAESSKPKRCFD